MQFVAADLRLKGSHSRGHTYASNRIIALTEITTGGPGCHRLSNTLSRARIICLLPEVSPIGVAVLDPWMQ